MRGARVRSIEPDRSNDFLAVPHPIRVPDGEYLAFCKRVHHDCQSRQYGERVYLYFELVDCEHEGETLRMFLPPSIYPTSNYYRAWAIARGGPPRSRNTKMSPHVFKGKLFRVLTATVKPRHRIAGDDGKMRPGPFLPEAFWYSKISCLLSLEVSNEKIVSITGEVNPEGGSAPLHPPLCLTDFSRNPNPKSELHEGRVGRRELGDGSKTDFAVRDGHHHNAPQPAGATEMIVSPAPSPHGTIEQQREILRQKGYLP